MKKKLPASAQARHSKEGQLNTKCHRVYKSGKSVNVLLTPSEAIKVAANILRKANLLDEEGLVDEWTVKLWSVGDSSLKFGLEPKRQGKQKKKSESN